jgi:hypothetical protein
VVVAISEEMQKELATVADIGPAPVLPPHPAPDALPRLMAMLEKAKRPLAVLGGGAQWTAEGRDAIRDWLVEAKASGLDSVPGTAAEILDDDVRWVLTKGKLPTSLWVEIVSTAHEVGLRSSSTMMYGHVDTPKHWVAHLNVLRGIQDNTGGFTEFVPLPFVHQSSPLYLAGASRPGPTHRDNRAVHALARIPAVNLTKEEISALTVVASDDGMKVLDALRIGVGFSLDSLMSKYDVADAPDALDPLLLEPRPLGHVLHAGERLAELPVGGVDERDHGAVAGVGADCGGGPRRLPSL